MPLQAVNRIDFIKGFTDQAIAIQAEEDLNPSKACISSSSFEQIIERFKAWHGVAIDSLNRLGYDDLRNLFQRLSDSDPHLQLAFSEKRDASFMLNRPRIQWILARFLNVMLMAENRAMLPAITLDSNCLIDYVQDQTNSQKAEDIETMIFGAALGRATVAITTRIHADTSRDSDSERKKRNLKYLARIQQIGTGFRLGFSTLDSKDILVPSELAEVTKAIQEVLFPKLSDDDKRIGNKLADVDHLSGHWWAMRDYFVTTDDHFLSKSSVLKEKFGITVLTPEECVLELASR